MKKAIGESAQMLENIKQNVLGKRINLIIITNFFMKSLKSNILLIGFVALMFFIDRYTKNKIINLMENQNSLYINDFLNFNLVFNTGIGFGLLSLDNTITYNFLTILILSIILVLFFLMIKSKKCFLFYSLIVDIGNL